MIHKLVYLLLLVLAVALVITLIILYIFLFRDPWEDDSTPYKPFSPVSSTNQTETFPNYDINPFRQIDTGMCYWSYRNFKRKYDLSSRNQCAKLMNIANSLNITYFLGMGSELQAYRNGGIIKGDHDIDIILPIWLNQHIFDCSVYIPINRQKYKKNSVVFDHSYEQCGRRKRHYHHRFVRYLNQLNGLSPFTVKLCRDTTQIWFNNTQPFLDFWMFLSNEFVYDNISICKCEFCGVQTYCMKDAVKYITKNYGADFMTPKKIPNDPPYTIPKPE